MRQVFPALWIGNIADRTAVADVMDLGIRAVVDLAAEEPPSQFPRDVIYVRVPLVDGGGNDKTALSLSIEAIGQLVADGVPTLVTCSVGLSRSPAIVAAAISRTRNESLQSALGKVLAGQPADVSPTLLSEVAEVLDAD